jgi:hypothetical protein
VRSLLVIAATIATLAVAQSPLSFEVASVKPFQGLATEVYVHVSGPKVTISEYGLLGLVMAAYKVEPWQISGGPAWLESDRFNIVANAPGDVRPTDDQIQRMLQSLLADRFQLKVHRDRRERLIYALVVDKKGPKLTRMIFKKQTMEYLALQVANSGGLGREVIDKTALTGTYDLTLHWASPDSNEPGVVTAVQEQLGLKLEPQKDAVEILVIDHAEKPSAN